VRAVGRSGDGNKALRQRHACVWLVATPLHRNNGRRARQGEEKERLWCVGMAANRPAMEWRGGVRWHLKDVEGGLGRLRNREKVAPDGGHGR